MWGRVRPVSFEVFWAGVAPMIRASETTILVECDACEGEHALAAAGAHRRPSDQQIAFLNPCQFPFGRPVGASKPLDTVAPVGHQQTGLGRDIQPAEPNALAE
jgi:hypothetical protein